MTEYNKFIAAPDPTPIMDDNGKPVILTDSERERWRDYLNSRQRKRTWSAAPQQATATAAQPARDDKEDYPF